jgi:hypothetical protein
LREKSREIVGILVKESMEVSTSLEGIKDNLRPHHEDLRLHGGSYESDLGYLEDKNHKPR